MGTIWLKPVVVLVNQGVYSAANDFTLRMKGLPQVKIVGVKTGGGGGLPMSSELPNGWAVRFSSSRTYDADGADIEQGITPDVVLKDEIARGAEVDPYIEPRQISSRAGSCRSSRSRRSSSSFVVHTKAIPHSDLVTAGDRYLIGAISSGA